MCSIGKWSFFSVAKGGSGAYIHMRICQITDSWSQTLWGNKSDDVTCWPPATSHKNTIYRMTVLGTLLQLSDFRVLWSKVVIQSHDWWCGSGVGDSGNDSTLYQSSSSLWVSDPQCSVFFCVWNHLTFDNIITCGYSSLSLPHNEDSHYLMILLCVCV